MQISRNQVLDWTYRLVEWESVVNTDGEKKIAEELFRELSQWEYFRRHPEHLWLVPTQETKQSRYSVVALVRSSRKVSDTTLLMGHIDTVGVEDYGTLKTVATSPDLLKEHLRRETVPPSVSAHLEQEDWLFGRGALDMKSGVAANLAVLYQCSLQTEEVGGNLLFVAECDEEDSSNGILSVVPFLNRLAEREGLVISAAINTDFVTARYEGDPNRYIYAGTVGKLLPSFFVTGKETHVGQAFDGFDPNLVLSELTRELDYNPTLCDEMYGETTPPPVSLKQTDLKPYYDVQTPLAGFAYYNYLVHSQSPREVMDILKEHAVRAFERAIQVYRERYEAYCQRTGITPSPVTLVPRVYTFEEYKEYLVHRLGERVDRALGEKAEELRHSDVDLRFACCRLVEELHRLDPDKNPVCILFYSSLYSPRIVLSPEQPREKRLLDAVMEAVSRVQPEYAHPIAVRSFFPYISDMSFVALSDDETGVSGYTANMPAWGTLHQVPFKEIRRLNVPIVNIGPYGFDAHKKWERVEITYSMEIVPKLIWHVLKELWKHP